MTAALLPDAEWRDASDLRRIFAALHDDLGGPYVVGGAVRDSLLGEQVTDIDIATPLIPDMVIDRLSAIGIKTIPTGIDHGTVTAVGDGKNYEVTTLRRDVATDGRRATVAFADNWQDDAARRDFTINALYADPSTGVIVDFFDGINDLKTGTIRFIGDAKTRIAEDHLRILRYFRFLARFGKGSPDPEAIAACAAAAHSLTALSRERIAQELMKTIMLPAPGSTIRLMQDHGIFAPFLPEIIDGAAQRLSELIEREALFKLPPTAAARLLTLLPGDPGIVDKVAARLKLSNRMRENLAARVGTNVVEPEEMRTLAYRRGIECARDIAMLRADGDELPACLQVLENWEVPRFALKGGDLIRRGLSAGPLVARTLKAVEQQWIDADFPDSNRLSEMADQAAAAALLPSKKL